MRFTPKQHDNAHHSAHAISPCDLDRLISDGFREAKALFGGLRLSAGMTGHLKSASAPLLQITIYIISEISYVMM